MKTTLNRSRLYTTKFADIDLINSHLYIYTDKKRYGRLKFGIV